MGKVDWYKIIELIILTLGIIATIVTIYFSVKNFKEGLEAAILQSKTEIMLDQTSKLPVQITEFCEHACNVAVGLWARSQGKLTSEMEKELKVSRTEQDQLFPEIKRIILAYGTKESVKIFLEFKNMIDSTKCNTKIEVYYILPLLLAQVKLDVTGEIVNPMVFQESLMPQFKEHRAKIALYINEIIIKLKLSDELKANIL